MKGRAYSDVGRPVLSPDGGSVAYKAVRRVEVAEKKWFGLRTVMRAHVKEFIVVGDQEEEDFDSVDRLIFGPGGKRVAYEAVKAGKTHVVVDGVKSKGFDEVLSFEFFPGGEVAYTGRKGAEWFVVVGGSAAGPFEEAFDPMFGPDGLRMAYVAKKDGSYRIHVDGGWSEGYEELGLARFSPDGSKLAFFARDGGRSWVKLMPLDREPPG